jgi:flagellar hook assembly protein FlgD
LRVTLVALVLALLASIGAAVPGAAPAARAASSVKVAIIVGATHGTTERYRDNADEIYAEAVKYSSNVVKVYSPRATAARVRDAVKGASIIVYLGHGNGWPSPYTYDPNYTTKDGFGLNADLNKDGKTTDYENKYYGEPWIRDLEPAPNAVVLLFHLCYASGNSEPGHAAPSLSTAKKRVDNYAAAFIRAGARAVVANGHSHDPYYIRALFSTRQTIDEYWRNAPDAHDNVTGYASERNPGYTFQLDPERAGSYYRSIAGKMTLRTQDVTGAPYADTARDPAAIVVPGNASPTADGSPVFGSVQAAQAGSDAVATLGIDARIRVEAREAATSWVDGSPIYRISSGEVEGWMAGSSLRPRDSAAPQTWEVDTGAGTFSPDGDGTGDTLEVRVRLSEPADWTLRIRDADGDVLDRADGESGTASIAWTPEPGSVAEGTYRWTLEATDGWGNGPLEDDGTVEVDLTAPDLAVDGDPDAIPLFTPNGDGSGDTVRFAVATGEPGTATATIRDAADEVVRRVTGSLGSGGMTLTWDGRDDDGTEVPDGEYRVNLTARDRAGNRSEAVVRHVAAYGALSRSAASASAFFPQDGDGIGNRVTLSFRLHDPAHVTWTVQDADGDVVRTLRTEAPLDPGTHSATWDGRTDDGAMVPRGTYRSVVTATDGTYAATQRVSVTADAFRISASDATPRRGQKLTVTAVSAEALDGAPRLKVYQPGRSAWAVTMKKVESRVYRVTIELRSGSTGTLRLRVSADDDRGGTQSSSLSLPIH